MTFSNYIKSGMGMCQGRHRNAKSKAATSGWSVRESAQDEMSIMQNADDKKVEVTKNVTGPEKN